MPHHHFRQTNLIQNEVFFMAWKDDLQDASFRGVHFECISTKDAVSKAQAIHQAPYANDALIEDMGKDPRKITIQAIYTGEDYKIWLDALEAALEQTGSGELIHPIYGLCYASVSSYSIDHDADNINACMISMDFILGEDQVRSLFVPVATKIKIEPTEILQVPSEALDKALQQEGTKESNLVFKTKNNLRQYVNMAREYLGLAKKTLDNALSPARWVEDLVDDVSRLVHFDTSISAISKWRDLIKRVERFGKIHQKHMETTNETTLPEVAKFWRATQVASTIQLTQDIIAQVRKEMREGQTISLTPIDLAIIRQQNRQLLQQVIREEREEGYDQLVLTAVSQIQVYKEIADQLHLQIQELIEVRPPITKITIDVPCTFHWLAYQLYGEASRAEEIRRLNPNLINPAVLQTGMELVVYAR